MKIENHELEVLSVVIGTVTLGGLCPVCAPEDYEPDNRELMQAEFDPQAEDTFVFQGVCNLCSKTWEIDGFVDLEVVLMASAKEVKNDTNK